MQSYERVKNHLEACDFDKDNKIFLKTHGTGTNPKDYSKCLDLHCPDYDSSLNIVPKGHVRADGNLAAAIPRSNCEEDPLTPAYADDRSPIVTPSLATSQSGAATEKSISPITVSQGHFPKYPPASQMCATMRPIFPPTNTRADQSGPRC